MGNEKCVGECGGVSEMYSLIFFEMQFELVLLFLKRRLRVCLPPLLDPCLQTLHTSPSAFYLDNRSVCFFAVTPRV